MSDKYVPIKPKSSAKDTVKSFHTLKKVGVGKEYVPIQPIEAGSMSVTESPVALQAKGGTEYMALKRVPSEGSGLTPLLSDGKVLSSSGSNVQIHQELEYKNTKILFDRQSGNIYKIMFNGEVISSYPTTDNHTPHSPFVTNVSDQIRDKYKIRAARIDDIYKPAPFVIQLFSGLKGEGRKVPICKIISPLYLLEDPIFREKEIGNGEGIGLVCIWKISLTSKIGYKSVLLGDATSSQSEEIVLTDDELRILGLDNQGDSLGNKDDQYLHVQTRVWIDNEGEIHFDNFHVDIRRFDNQQIDKPLYGIRYFEYPIIRGIKEPEKDLAKQRNNHLLLPYMEGILMVNPWKRLQADIDPWVNNKMYYKEEYVSKKRDIHSLRMVMDYPSGYQATMQFSALYATNKETGLYFATHDESMAAKTYIWEAYRAKREFTYSVIHYNDDICEAYQTEKSTIVLASQNTLDRFFKKAVSTADCDPVRAKLNGLFGSPFRNLRQSETKSAESKEEGEKSAVYWKPIWKNYRQTSYSVTVGLFNKKGYELIWYDAADKYKKWARDTRWAKVPRAYRDTEERAFYKDTGYAIWLLGSEYNLANLQGLQKRNFIKAFKDILRTDDSVEPPRVLFVSGWDWHAPWGIRRNACLQRGRRKEYWYSRFGTPNENLLPDNYKYLTYLNNLYQIHLQGDFILPYIFANRMHRSDHYYDNHPLLEPPNGPLCKWEGWFNHLLNSEGKELDPGSPWVNKQTIPYPSGDPDTRIMCPATSAFSRFLKVRDRWIREGNFNLKEVNSSMMASGTLYVDGVYHDIGYNYGNPECLWCEEGEEDDLTKHVHSFNTNGKGFQVGRGGFINQARRDSLLINLYGTASPSPRALRSEIFGTEAMTEILIDAIDCFGCFRTWGPYKPFDYATATDLGQGEIGSFGGMFKWIREHNCVEIPLMQYIYNPVMPLKLSGHLTLSGGENSAHDVGTAFFWVAAKSYLSGFIIRLDYDQVPVDILSSMYKRTDTYMLFWNRFVENPEKQIWPAKDGRGNPAPGRHPINNPPSFDAINRTYADPLKEQFLRMMSHLRCKVLPEYLVYGEMMRPAHINEEDNPLYSFDYDIYWSFAENDYPIMQEWSESIDLNPDPDSSDKIPDGLAWHVARDQLEHKTNDFKESYYWIMPIIVTAAWKADMPDGAHIVYILINASSEKISKKVNFHYGFNPSEEYGSIKELKCDVLRMVPNDPEGWSKWDTSSQKDIEIDDAEIVREKATILGGLDAHEVYILKIHPKIVIGPHKR